MKMKREKTQKCCKMKENTKKIRCMRNSDKKIFLLPRYFSKKQCESMIKKKGYTNLGFTARSSCAPYKDCVTRKHKGGSRKTRKVIKVIKVIKMQHKPSGIAVLHENKYNVTGTVKFIPIHKNRMKINYKITGLKDGKHGFHIHEYGDLTDGCASACAHFNPYGSNHGGLSSKERHLGDLGNITSKNKTATGTIVAPNLSFSGKNSIVGRMIIVHEDEDDCGLYKGHDLKKQKETIKTGNAGKRLACGVIGYKK